MAKLHIRVMGKGWKNYFHYLTVLMSIPTNVTSSMYYKIAASGDALENIDTYIGVHSMSSPYHSVYVLRHVSDMAS